VRTAALRERLARVGPLSDARHLARELWWMAWDTPGRARARFEREFAAGPDPWDYAGPGARERHSHALGLLDAAGLGAVQRAFEVGCAEGHFTAQLAPRCRELLAVDVSPLALARARARCGSAPCLRFAEWDLRRGPVPARFDLVVAMDVLEGFCRPQQVRAARARLVGALRPGGHLLLGNSRQGELFETTWWGRALIRGGKWIDWYVAGHPALEVVATGTGGFFVNTLFRRRR
jgi:SAM-dependent methyltransferase